MIIEIILTIVGIYLICGFVFAIAFITKGINIVDEGAHGSTVGFRVIIIAGVIVLWVLLLKKWLNANKAKLHD